MKDSKTKTVGLIGCGAIGTLVAQAIEKRIIKCDKLVLFDYQQNKAINLRQSIDFDSTIVNSLEEMLKLNPIVIIEAASQKAAKDYIKPITTKGIHLIVMSSGALLGMDYQSKKLHVPSGAIGGLDAISSAALTHISEVILTTKKNPRAFEMNNSQPKIIYEGTAETAAKLYPRSMNVASTLSFIVKPTKVQVQLISDPNTKRNTHEIQIKWEFGQMLLRFSNDPHPENPRTSALAAWSAINLLNTLLNK